MKARVYVGACVDVRYRWHGTSREEFDAYRKSEPSSTVAMRRSRLYVGHKRKYAKMFILCSAHATVSILLEPLLISVAKLRCEGDGSLYCENIAVDGRGQALDHNWIYVCIGEVPVAPLSSGWKRKGPFALS